MTLLRHCKLGLSTKDSLDLPEPDTADVFSIPCLNGVVDSPFIVCFLTGSMKQFSSSHLFYPRLVPPVVLSCLLLLFFMKFLGGNQVINVDSTVMPVIFMLQAPSSASSIVHKVEPSAFDCSWGVLF